MDFLIADTSTYGLARLTSDEPKPVKVPQEALLWLLPASSGPSSQALVRYHLARSKLDC